MPKYFRAAGLVRPTSSAHFDHSLLFTRSSPIQVTRAYHSRLHLYDTLLLFYLWWRVLVSSKTAHFKMINKFLIPHDSSKSRVFNLQFLRIEINTTATYVRRPPQCFHYYARQNYGSFNIYTWCLLKKEK